MHVMTMLKQPVVRRLGRGQASFLRENENVQVRLHTGPRVKEQAKAGPIAVVFILGPNWAEFKLTKGMGLEPIKVIIIIKIKKVKIILIIILMIKNYEMTKKKHKHILKT